MVSRPYLVLWISTRRKSSSTGSTATKAGRAAATRRPAGYLARATDALAQLRNLTEPPPADIPDLRRVRQSKEFQVWRTAHPFDPDIAFRLICWFPPDNTTIVVALFGADKAQMGDVFYNSVGNRADAAIRQWTYQTREEDSPS